MKIGDRVKIINKAHKNRTDLKHLSGLTGTIIDFTTISQLVGIEFDNFIDGHECNGSGKHGYCWYVDKKFVKLEDNIFDFKKEMDSIVL
jgi:hypothetical protein